ncbi:hypothetical protein RFI_28370 [Reticulomyxa filosa]|uniref:Uncharacterized protein n=1 Tax=Reticulomyxa filosa TaxID=46433 RepID=X6M7K3_RETFI|nr:hypothetical protein RFI_28370 [Reticulomyxa filosa]|eukprot:ETO09015.1 hypothetical protein RFI_28370 [Reticulomyxa filosa]
MIYLWPFSKGQMQDYIDKFVKMRKNNKMNDKSNWTIQQYDETLKNYPNLHKMMEDHSSFNEGHLHAIYEAKFSPDGTKVVSCSNDNTIRIWDVSSGHEILKLTAQANWVKRAQFSPDNSKVVFCSGSKTIKIWDLPFGRDLFVIEGHVECTNGIRFSPDGSKVVSCSRDKTIRLWDVESGLNAMKSEVSSDAMSSKDTPTKSSLSTSISSETCLAKCIWQVGIQSCGLSMRGSVWRNVHGLTSQQKLFVGQRGGKF